MQTSWTLRDYERQVAFPAGRIYFVNKKNLKLTESVRNQIRNGSVQSSLILKKCALGEKVECLH